MNSKTHLMKGLLALSFLAIGLSFKTIAQPVGANYSNPVVVGTITCSTFFSDTKNNNPANGYGNDYTISMSNGQASDDIVYQFTLASTADVIISTCNSVGGISDSYIHLVDNTASHNEIAYNDDNGGICTGYLASLTKTSLVAGTYFVVVEGYKATYGNITTNISLTTTPIGATIYNPIEATFGSCPNSSFIDTKTNSTCYGNEIGRPGNDIFYKFTLSETKSVSISTCGSNGLDTYLHLYNSSRTEIDFNDDYGPDCINSQSASIIRNAQNALPAGTYYVAIETYASTAGSIYLDIYPFCGIGVNNLASPNNIPTAEDLNLKVYPNPFLATTILKLDGITGKVKIEIVNINGAIVYKNETYTANESITLGEDFPAGVYLVKATDEKTSKLLKLAKVQ